MFFFVYYFFSTTWTLRWPIYFFKSPNIQCSSVTLIWSCKQVTVFVSTEFTKSLTCTVSLCCWQLSADFFWGCFLWHSSNKLHSWLYSVSYSIWSAVIKDDHIAYYVAYKCRTDEVCWISSLRERLYYNC